LSGAPLLTPFDFKLTLLLLPQLLFVPASIVVVVVAKNRPQNMVMMPMMAMMVVSLLRHHDRRSGRLNVNRGGLHVRRLRSVHLRRRSHAGLPVCADNVRATQSRKD
jgi:hypothetical protein